MDRPNDFPYEPRYSTTKLQREFRKIPSLTPTIGDDGVLRETYADVVSVNKLTNNFSQPQRMKCKRKGYDYSPYDLYQTLRPKLEPQINAASTAKEKREILKRIRKQIFRDAPACSLFNISRVVYLMKTLFGDDLSNVRWLDMSAGWGDRLLAAIGLGIEKYYGTDPNDTMKLAYQKINETFVPPEKRDSYQVEITPFEDATIEPESYDIAFTSPPFYDFEIYNEGDDKQSTTRYPDVDTWKTEFLYPYIKKAWSKVKSNGYLVLYIEEHEDTYVTEFIKYWKNIGEHSIIEMGYTDREDTRKFYVWRKTNTQNPAVTTRPPATTAQNPATAQNSATVPSTYRGGIVDADATTQKIPIDGLTESTKNLAEQSEEGNWVVPRGVVPALSLRRDIVDEDRLQTKNAGSGSVTPRLYYEDGTPAPYTGGDVLDIVRQNPEERGAPGLLSRLITKMLSSQTPEERAAYDPDKGVDMAVACARDEDGDDSVSSFIYQDFLKRYMRSRTPERGVLVYHGLGSGKTATSIGMIESCLDSRRIIIILPASLKDNYRRQLEKFVPAFFGNGYLGGDRHWRFRAIGDGETTKRKEISAKLGVPEEAIQKIGGVFELDEDDSKGGIPRLSLDREERKKLDFQIVKTIFSKITMYSSNGMSSRNSKKKKQKEKEQKSKPKRESTRLYAEDIDLDNAVVICDEFHRIISMRKNLSPVGIALYNKIRDAKNSKIVALSGTPVVNAPYEVALIANMLHGKQSLYIFKMAFSDTRSPADRTDEAVTRDVLHDPVVRFTQVQPSSHRGGGNELVVVRHPTGFRSVYDSQGAYAGVVYEPDWKGHGKDDNTGWQRELANRLRKRGIKILQRPSDVRIEHDNWLPEQEDVFLEMYTTPGSRDAEGDEIIARREELARRLLGKISYYRGADLHLLPDAPPIKVVRVPMSDEQFAIYTKKRDAEIELEDQLMKKKPKNEQPKGDDDMFGARVMTRPTCNMIFPESIERPSMKEIRDYLGETSVNSKRVLEAYAEESRLAIQSLREHPAFNVDDLGERLRNLRKYSPKMVAMIDRIQKTDGLVLIYSNYLHMEGLDGVGVFLEAIGYEPINLVYDTTVKEEGGRKKRSKSRGGSDSAESSLRVERMIQTEELPEEREAFIKAPKYMIYSGEVDDTKRSMIVSLFRGEVSRLPSSLRRDVVTILGGEESVRSDGTDNLKGEIVKAMMITGAGAEGLDLRGIRQVHILEPYWNRAREEQVFGRAVRICSHALLPPDQRNVDRYAYLSTFGDDQLTEGDAGFLMMRDDGKTTDEYIYELASRKQRVIDAFLRLMRSVAVDCALHAKKNDMLPSECYVAPRGDIRELATPSYADDKDDLRVIKAKRLRGLIDIEAHLVYKDHKGTEYPRGSAVVVYDPETRIAYEMDPMLTGYVEPIGEMSTSVDGVDRIVLYRDIYGDKEDVAPPAKSSGSATGSATGVPAVTSVSAVEPSRKPFPRFVFREETYTLDPSPDEYQNAVTQMMDAAMWDLIPRCVNTQGVAIFAIGHPGSGKSSRWRDIYSETTEKYPERLPSENAFVRIDPDEFLFHNPFFVAHLRERMAAISPDGTVTLNPAVVGNKVIRRMIRDGTDELLRICIQNRYSFVYESLWQDTEYYYENVYLPTREAFQYVFVYVFQNDNVEDVVSGLAERAEATGRYVPEAFAREKWEEGMNRTLLADGVQYTGGPLIQQMDSVPGSGGVYLIKIHNGADEDTIEDGEEIENDEEMEQKEGEMEDDEEIEQKEGEMEDSYSFVFKRSTRYK